MSEVEITPRCLKGEAIFVSNDGWLLPCCYVHIYLRRAMALPDKFTYNDHWFTRNRDLFDLKTRTVAEILADPRWEELRRSWTDGTAPTVCYRTCGVPTDMPFKDIDAVRQRDRTFTKLDRPPCRAHAAATRQLPTGGARATQAPVAVDVAPGSPASPSSPRVLRPQAIHGAVRRLLGRGTGLNHRRPEAEGPDRSFSDVAPASAGTARRLPR